jgi:molecular chaperone DnaK (HSP70)
MVFRRANLDVGQRTNRSPKELQTYLTPVAPYTIGIEVTGDLIESIIQRGQELPTTGEGSMATREDNQAEVSFRVFQGEHVLSELNACIGSATPDGIPPMPRWKATMLCTIEYTDNRILLFSARETRGRQSVNAVFTAKTEFTEADRVGLNEGSQVSTENEGIMADRRYFRSHMMKDVERAEKWSNNTQFTAVARYWR